MVKTNKLRYVIGADIGGTDIKFGIVDSEGRLYRKISLNTKALEGVNEVIAQLKKGIKILLQSSPYKIDGIGIGAPGTVTPIGTVEYPPNLPNWKIVNLKQIIEKEFSKKVKLENDANAAAVGEMFFGAGRNKNSFIMVTLGTGVGGGIILNKKLFRGEFGAAGEIGHMSIDFNGSLCRCGSLGCIETFVGNSYLVNEVKDSFKLYPDSKIYELINNDLSLITPKIISEAAKLNDNYALEIVEKMGSRLGFALASAANLTDINLFIIGGGVSGFGRILITSINKNIKLRVLRPIKPRVKVLAAKLKNNAGIKGASALVLFENKF